MRGRGPCGEGAHAGKGGVIWAGAKPGDQWVGQEDSSVVVGTGPQNSGTGEQALLQELLLESCGRSKAATKEGPRGRHERPGKDPNHIASHRGWGRSRQGRGSEGLAEGAMGLCEFWRAPWPTINGVRSACHVSVPTYLHHKQVWRNHAAAVNVHNVGVIHARQELQLCLWATGQRKRSLPAWKEARAYKRRD